MYLKDKGHHVTVRMNNAQFRFLRETSKIVDVKPAEFMRMVITAAMATDAALGKTQAKGVKRHANIKARIDN